jgi:hypothetical protein
LAKIEQVLGTERGALFIAIAYGNA